jgi:hypothetical protein
MARLMPALEFRSFHSHRSCAYVPNTTRLADLTFGRSQISKVRDQSNFEIFEHV